jgi:Winged helix-turn helix
MKARYWPCFAVNRGDGWLDTGSGVCSKMCMNIRYRVTLTAEERHQLQALLSGGQEPVRKIKRAQILLAADAHSTDDLIALTVGVGTSTVYRTKQRFVEEGLAPALSELPVPARRASSAPAMKPSWWRSRAHILPPGVPGGR